MLLVHLFVCFLRVSFLSFISSSWCRGLAAICDCGTPWTFLLTLLCDAGDFKMHAAFKNDTILDFIQYLY